MNARKKIRYWFKKHLPGLQNIIANLNTRQRWFFIWRRAGLLLSEEKKGLSYLKKASRFKTRKITKRNSKAVDYVGTQPKEGIAQLAVLMYHGCKPSHRVFEIGCGSLTAGYPIMQYLDAGNYVGVDPNKWLLDRALEDPEIQKTVNEKKARFLYNENFDASEYDIKFDYIISHSILSHAAHWQWPIFMENVNKVTKPGSIVLASLHFTQGNAYGGPTYDGSETDFDQWVYPGNSFFFKETIFNLAKKYNFDISVDLVAPALITRTHRSAVHTWIKMVKK